MSSQPDIGRRDLLRSIAATVLSGGMLSGQEAQHVHHAVAQQKSAAAYKPQALTPHEYQTLQRLSDLIIPADGHSQGALEAGAASFIDFLCGASDEMKEIYTGGLGWLDDYTMRQHGKTFVVLDPSQQTALLDLIAWRKNSSPELNPGIDFFAWVRRLVADAYYTSPIGMKDLGYMGNGAMSEFKVPEEAVQYALKRSP